MGGTRLAAGSLLGSLGRRPQELSAGPRSTGWKTRGVVLRAPLTVLTGGVGVSHEDTPPYTKTVPLMAVLFLKHFES